MARAPPAPARRNKVHTMPSPTGEGFPRSRQGETDGYIHLLRAVACGTRDHADPASLRGTARPSRACPSRVRRCSRCAPQDRSICRPSRPETALDRNTDVALRQVQHLARPLSALSGRLGKSGLVAFATAVATDPRGQAAMKRDRASHGSRRELAGAHGIQPRRSGPAPVREPRPPCSGLAVRPDGHGRRKARRLRRPGCAPSRQALKPQLVDGADDRRRCSQLSAPPDRQAVCRQQVRATASSKEWRPPWPSTPLSHAGRGR